MVENDPFVDDVTISPLGPSGDRELSVRTRNHCFASLPQSLLIAVICTFCFHLTLLTKGQAGLLLYFVITTLSAQVILAALWAVWGPGDYLSRLFWSHLIFLGPTWLGMSAPLFIFSFSPEMNRHDMVQGMILIAAGIPAVSWSAQLPFWIVRFWSGCQIIVEGNPPRASATIRDIMVFMCLSGLAFGAPQLAADLTIRAGSHNTVQVKQDPESTLKEPVYFDQGRVYLTSLRYSYFSLSVFVFILTSNSLLLIHSVFLSSRNGNTGRRMAFGLLLLCFAIPMLGCILAGLIFDSGTENMILGFIFGSFAWALFLLPYLLTLIYGILSGTRCGMRIAD